MVTAATKGQLNVRSLIPDGKGALMPHRWMASKAWYSPEAARNSEFVLLNEHESRVSFGQSAVIRTFGEPKEEQQIGDYAINVYDPGRLALLLAR